MKEQLTGQVDSAQQTLNYGRKTFWVKLMINIPYPKEFEYRKEASSIGTAINRAIAEMRKEMKRKKIIEVKVIAKKL